MDDVVFVCHLNPDDLNVYNRYKDIAEQYRDRFSFGLGGPVQQHSVLRCSNNVDDEQHMTDELGSVEAMTDFVQLCSTPLIPELIRKNEAQFMQASAKC